MTRRRSPSRNIVASCGLILTGLAAIGGASASARLDAMPAAQNIARIVEMQHHFLQVTSIHEAVIRGDLEAVVKPATELSRIQPPPGMPDPALPFIPYLRVNGLRAAAARNLTSAASAAASMLSQCGECHVASGVRPAIVPRASPDVGGIVGHMLEHQLAVNELARGLILPSATEWQQGAARLRTAPLRSLQIPPDEKLTKTVRTAEVRVHEMADRASKAETTEARAAAYASVLTTCAECHTLHGTIWGPRTQPQ